MAEWSDEQKERLRVLWDEGLTTAAIGRELDVSKNAVIGKARRLNLPGRPSPVKRYSPDLTAEREADLRRMRLAGYSHRTMAAALGISTSYIAKELLRLGLTSACSWPRPKITLPPLVSILRKPERVSVSPPERKPAPVTVFKPRNFGQCCWVVGKARYCDDPITQRGPYCDDHRKLAYRPTKDLRRDAA